jgi:hypothetical protein
MATNKVYRFKDSNEAALFLNGALIGGAIERGFLNLVGRKIKFTTPVAAEHTFVAGATIGILTLQEIKAQLEAAVTGLAVRSYQGRIVLQSATGVVLINATSLEARGLLGLDAQGTVTAKVYTPAAVTPVAPCWTALQVDDNNYHTIYTWE